MNSQVKIKTKEDQFLIDQFMACPLPTILEWNDLMAIVEHIEALGYEVNISGISCNIYKLLEKDNPIVGWVCGDRTKKIDICLLAIVQFLKEHYQNK